MIRASRETVATMRTLAALVAAQFFSGLADNALLLVVMARLKSDGDHEWLAPLLKVMFTLAYVLLAPWVGQLADRWPKQQVMSTANAIKAMACLAMLLGSPELLAFCAAGIGAAIYSPAKYGLITELVPERQLVAANGWMEVGTVMAILLGIATGGVLTSNAWTNWFGALAADAALVAVLVFFAVAGLLNLRIPGVLRRSDARLQWRLGCSEFIAAMRCLWRDPHGQTSLMTTTLFWGIGALLQFIVLRWADERLGLTLSEAAYLQALSGAGVVIGAILAGVFVRMKNAASVLPMGILMGLLMPLMLLVQNTSQAALLLAFVGALSGWFVVPMNALLQSRGSALLSAGRSVAVQNFSENLSVLALLTLYSRCVATAVSLDVLIWLCSALVAGVMSGVAWRHSHHEPNDSLP